MGALEVSIDPDFRFELAVQLGQLDTAHQIALEDTQSDHKWKQLADLALTQSKFGLAEEALSRAQDLDGLLLLYSSLGNGKGLRHLAETAVQQGQNNVAFLCYFLTQQLDKAIDLLIAIKRIPEAAFLARTYAPSHVSRVVGLWRQDLSKVNPKAAESLADPMEYENMFPDIKLALT